MTAAFRASMAYFAIAFAVGFVLGTIRVLVVVPLFGDTGAVLLELPVMLAVSWFASAWLVGRLAVSPAARERLVMGAVAFALLMLAELSVSVFRLRFRPAGRGALATYQTPGAQLGLAAQIAFALFPWLQRDAAR